ncbi:DNA translocase FtsK [Pseudomonas lactis]|uniref:DNA translocase FtsK n=1 Tax=Pseudomonas lactis TaxID=1615674 RepID=UPI0019F8F6E3|nr:DNA translocase FtsK [Pseudomonas lactis]MBA6043864.1 DNA translocase FtsK [Pseudomonas lactis]
MKAEHNAIIERAKLGGYEPSMIAHELLVHDLVEAALFEFRNVRAPFHSLNEGQQQEVIDRVTESATKSVYNAISIISSRNVDTIPVTIVDAKFKAKAITVTAAIDAQDPNRHGLIDVAGRLCLLVLAPNDYAEGLDGIRPDRDQPDLPLHVSDLTGSLFDKRPTGADEPDGQDHPLGTAEDLAERTGEARPVSEFAEVGKEFGDFTYDDAAQLIVLKAAPSFGIDWMQSRLAISSEQAETLLLRLIDNQVVELLIEGDTWTENTYTVIATLDDLGPNLSVE